MADGAALLGPGAPELVGGRVAEAPPSALERTPRGRGPVLGTPPPRWAWAQWTFLIARIEKQPMTAQAMEIGKTSV